MLGAPPGRGCGAGAPGMLAHVRRAAITCRGPWTSGAVPWPAASGVAEGGRFELPRGRPLAVFKTAAIGRSAIPPPEV